MVVSAGFPAFFLGVSCGCFFSLRFFRCLVWFSFRWAGRLRRASLGSLLLRLGVRALVSLLLCGWSVRGAGCAAGWPGGFRPSRGRVLVRVGAGWAGVVAVGALLRLGRRWGARRGRGSAWVFCGRGGGLVVGFCGSRSLPGACAGQVAAVVAALSPAGVPVAVGCAAGADAMVRAACPSAVVFRASSFGSGRGSFAARSVALVRAVAASPSPLLVGFASSACPAGVVPAASWRSGVSVSGSWSSLALAAGLGCAVRVVWCGPGAAVLPSWAGGAWVAGVVAGVAVWSWVAVEMQPGLFD